MKTFHNPLSILSTLTLALLVAPETGSAQLYNLQLNYGDSGSVGAYSGAAQIGTAGDMWNNPDWVGVGSGSTTLFSGVSLFDSTGAASGVTATMTAAYNDGLGWNATPTAGTFNHYTGRTGGSATIGLMDYEVKLDYKPSQQSVTLTLNGLPANTSISAYVYGAGDGAGQGGAWTLDAANGGDSALIQYDGSATGRDVTLASSQGLSWEVLSGTTDGSGNLTIVGSNGSANGGTWWQTYVNGIQVQVAAVPEPSSAALAGVGIAALFIFRRRRV